MKKTMDKYFSWIKDQIVFVGSMASIVLFIVFIKNALTGVSARMTPIVINIIGAVFFLLLSIGLFYLWLYQRSEKHRKKDEDAREKIKMDYEEITNKLKNELDEETKKCNEEYTSIKSKLEDKRKQLNDLIAFHESDLKKKVQLTDCDIKLHYKEGNPKLTITQNFINMSYDKLLLKSLFLYVVADGVEIDKIVYDSENATSDMGKKIFISDLPPYDINCWITCETTRLPRSISNNYEEKMKIDIDGAICFYIQSGKVTKKVKETKEFEDVKYGGG